MAKCWQSRHNVNTEPLVKKSPNPPEKNPRRRNLEAVWPSRAYSGLARHRHCCVTLDSGQLVRDEEARARVGERVDIEKDTRRAAAAASAAGQG